MMLGTGLSYAKTQNYTVISVSSDSCKSFMKASCVATLRGFDRMLVFC